MFQKQISNEYEVEQGLYLSVISIYMVPLCLQAAFIYAFFCLQTHVFQLYLISKFYNGNTIDGHRNNRTPEHFRKSSKEMLSTYSIILVLSEDRTKQQQIQMLTKHL